MYHVNAYRSRVVKIRRLKVYPDTSLYSLAEPCLIKLRRKRFSGEAPFSAVIVRDFGEKRNVRIRKARSSFLQRDRSQLERKPAFYFPQVVVRGRHARRASEPEFRESGKTAAISRAEGCCPNDLIRLKISTRGRRRDGAEVRGPRWVPVGSCRGRRDQRSSLPRARTSHGPRRISRRCAACLFPTSAPVPLCEERRRQAGGRFRVSAESSRSHVAARIAATIPSLPSAVRIPPAISGNVATPIASRNSAMRTRWPAPFG